MITTTTFSDFSKIAKEKYLVPIHRQLLADTETPVSVFAKLRPYFQYPFLLESVEGGEKLARYSFIGWENSANFIASGNKWKLNILNNNWKDWLTIDKSSSTKDALKTLLKKVKIIF